MQLVDGSEMYYSRTLPMYEVLGTSAGVAWNRLYAAYYAGSAKITRRNELSDACRNSLAWPPSHNVRHNIGRWLLRGLSGHGMHLGEGSKQAHLSAGCL